MRHFAAAIFLASTFALGQTVTVGTASTVQAGGTTTITVPVTVTGATTGTGTVAAGPLPMLSVETNAANASQVVGPVFTTIAMSNVIVDTVNGWSTTNNAYTVPNTGTYLIVSNVRLVDGAPSGISYGQGVNTANVDGSFFDWTTTAGLRNVLQNVRLVKLTAGQAVDLYGYMDRSNALGYASLTIQELN